MKTSLFSLASLILGAFIGWYLFSFTSQMAEPSYVPHEINYERLFRLASVKINDDNFMCEGFSQKTVGAVLSSIFKANSNQYKNKINEYCGGNECAISFNSCKSWQSDSCGSTFLKFKLTDKDEMDPDTFQCLQLP